MILRASCDAWFLKDSHIRCRHRTARRRNERVRGGGESEISVRENGDPVTLHNRGRVMMKSVVRIGGSSFAIGDIDQKMVTGVKGA